MTAVFVTLHFILNFYWWIIIAAAVFSWLYAFNVVNPGNRVVAQIGQMLYQLTEPVLRPVRRIIPNLGTIDISPIVVLFAIIFLQIFLRTTIAPAFGVAY